SLRSLSTVISSLFYFLRLYERGLRIRAEVLHHALRDQYEGADNAERKQQIERAASKIDPEIAYGLCLLPRYTTDKGDCQHNTRSCRSEVVEGQPCHLHQITHGRFAGVRLPIRVGSETGGCIEGEVWRHTGKLLRIERQIVLKPLHCIKQE